MAMVTADAVGSDMPDASGYYEITVPYNWSGTVRAVLIGYHFTDKNYTNVISDQTEQDFEAFQPTLSGYVRKQDGTGLSRSKNHHRPT